MIAVADLHHADHPRGRGVLRVPRHPVRRPAAVHHLDAVRAGLHPAVPRRRPVGHPGRQPTIDYQVNNSYVILGHFHYTLFAGSVFGFFAGVYLWFPKASGIMLGEKLGKLHFAIMVVGANVTFIPFFILGYDGMPRWMATYPAGAGFTTLRLISSIGAGVIGPAMLVSAYNVYVSARARVPAPDHPWHRHSLEWATSSPRPRYNFDLAHPVPRVRSYTPLLDWREHQRPPAGTGPS
jgi:cytochrome c oxidase subunit I